MNTQRGLTLLEVMIAVVIVAILAAIGYPAYTEQIARGHRAEGKTALLRAAQLMERFYTIHNCYPSATPPCGNAATSAAALAAAGISAHSGDTPANSSYTLSVTTNAQDYTLTATLSNFRDAKCGNLTLTNTGLKGRTGSGSVTDCWAK